MITDLLGKQGDGHAAIERIGMNDSELGALNPVVDATCRMHILRGESGVRR
ncbi:MAG: hypothetical protein ACLFM0_06770 [Spirochaetales bacterium]